MPIIGRRSEQEILNRILTDREAQFLTIYGRRRVGKTFLIREFFKDRCLFMEVTGKKDAPLSEQLAIFHESFRKTFPKVILPKVFTSWRQTFELLTEVISLKQKPRDIVLFLDELPWLSTPRSGLLQELDHFWNTKWSKLNHFKLICCGSAAAWMLNNLVHAKGGLHNRVTQSLQLLPMTLRETREYLDKKSGVRMTDKQIVELYMAIGGIPFYLNHVERGLSPAQVIDKICFQRDGLLYSEFERIFPALFTRSEKHARLVREIAKKPHGISRDELITKSGIGSGGALNRPLDELEAAGFIQRFVPYGRATRDSFFRITDEYTIFYLHWLQTIVQRNASLQKNYWQNISQTPKWSSWTGYAFEGICQKHGAQLLKALGISGIAAEMGAWQYLPKVPGEKGAQIDLLFDRADGIISICEIKFVNEPFVIDKRRAAALRDKVAIFKEKTKTRKSIQVVLISPFGVRNNEYSRELIARDLAIEALFE